MDSCSKAWSLWRKNFMAREMERWEEYAPFSRLFSVFRVDDSDWNLFLSPTLSFFLSLSRREIKTSSKVKNPFFIRINSGGIYIRRKGSICRGKEKSFSFLLSFFFAIRIKKFTLSRLHTFSQGWRRRGEGITKAGASAEILIKSFKVARVKLLKDKRTKWRVSKA